ncbi:hypothetical protein [Flavobacterium sp.]|jgi:hypothetical protein|uniref:hypothetical protein n=1 Tax=Flavobacterium sp. TaxID=239 RepID=UPI0037BF9630
MNKELQELSAKIDKILEMQELILSKLSQSTILAKEPIIPTQKLTKKEVSQQKMDEFSLIFDNQHRLQSKFNLATVPQKNRVLEYLRTNEPKVFDGLKRRK